jgi:large subunit ribosomal protein L17
MRHRTATFKINRSSAHVRALLANAVCSLIEHRQIRTTLVRAKRIRQVAEQMVTFGKRGTLHARRLAIARIHQPDKVKILFDEIAPSFKERQGGYTRIVKLGKRIGDATEMCILSFVESDAEVAAAKKAEAEAAAAAPAPAEAQEEAKPAEETKA